MEKQVESSQFTLGEVVNLQTQENPSTDQQVNERADSQTHGSRYVELNAKLLQSWVAKHEVTHESELPWVPLCRLIGNEAVRSTRSSVADMGCRFRQAGYMPSLGNFLISEQLPDGRIIPVSEDDEKKWDASFWGDINREFDKELSLSKSWAHLVGQKLVVWDGNHRLKAWTSEINNACHEDRSKYVRVKCTMTSFSPDEECSMLLALDCLNSLTQTHIKRTIASDIFMIRRLGLGNEQSWRKYFDEEALKEIEAEIRDDKKRHPWIWWKIPLGLLMQLVYSGDFKEGLTSKMEETNLHPDNENYEAGYKRCIREVEHHLKSKKGFKLARISNPGLGEKWVNKLYDLDWDSDHNVTMDKLVTLAQTPLSSERKVFALDRLLSKDVGKLWRFDGGDREWRNYVAHYSYWECIIERAMELIKGVSKVPWEPFSEAMRTFFDECQQNHIGLAFKDMQKLTPGTSKKKMHFLEPTARRFAYRWFACLLKDEEIEEIPSSIEEWRSTECAHYKSLYPRSWLDARRTLPTSLEDIPWFLEYPDQEYPENEKDLYNDLMKKKEISKTCDNPRPKLPPKGGKGQAGKPKSPSKPIGKKSPKKPASKKRGRSREKDDEKQSRPGKKSKSLKKDTSEEHEDFEKSKEDDEEHEDSEKSKEDDESILQAFVSLHLPLAFDICHIQADTFGGANGSLHQTITKFLRKVESCEKVEDEVPCTLVWADLPCGLAPFMNDDVIPEWNEWRLENVSASLTIAETFLSLDGFFVTTASIEHQHTIVSHILRQSQLEVVHTLFLETAIPNKRLMSGDFENVSTLVITFFSRRGSVRTLDRVSSSMAAKEGCFDIRSDKIVELPQGGKVDLLLKKNKEPLRGAAERHKNLCSVLITMCTRREEVVIDCFAGVGNMARACEEWDRHCISIELDTECHNYSLNLIGDQFDSLDELRNESST